MFGHDQPPAQYGDSHSREFIPAEVMREMFADEGDAQNVPTPEYFTD